MKSQVYLLYANLPCSSEILEKVRQETDRDPVSKKIIQMLRACGLYVSKCVSYVKYDMAEIDIKLYPENISGSNIEEEKKLQQGLSTN